jgi:dethiobiotin synthetase
MAHGADNLAALRHELARRHQAPCLGVVPWLATPTPAAVAAYLDNTALQNVFSPLSSFLAT